MRVKINFNGSIPYMKNKPMKEVYSWFYSVCDAEMAGHGKQTPCSVSCLLGYKPVEGGISYDNGAFLYVSSMDDEFIKDFVSTLNTCCCKNISDNNGGFLTFSSVEPADFEIGERYDIVKTTGPILLRDKLGKEISVNDDGYFSELETHSIKKLIKFGVNPFTANTIRIVPPKDEKKYKEVHDQGRLCSRAQFMVKGDPDARKSLFEMGFGYNTKGGYGSVDVLPKKI